MFYDFGGKSFPHLECHGRKRIGKAEGNNPLFVDESSKVAGVANGLKMDRSNQRVNGVT